MAIEDEIRAALSGGRSLTVAELSRKTGHPEASVRQAVYSAEDLVGEICSDGDRATVAWWFDEQKKEDGVSKHKAIEWLDNQPTRDEWFSVKEVADATGMKLNATRGALRRGVDYTGLVVDKQVGRITVYQSASPPLATLPVNAAEDVTATSGVIDSPTGFFVATANPADSKADVVADVVAGLLREIRKLASADRDEHMIALIDAVALLVAS